MPPFERLATELIMRLSPADFAVGFTSFSRDGDVVTFSGALPQTMHFGVATLDLSTGVVTYEDQDHRDGGGYEMGRVTLTAEQLESLKRA